MEYVHIPTGVRVTSDIELPRVLYKPVEKAEAPKRKPRTATRKRQPKE